MPIFSAPYAGVGIAPRVSSAVMVGSQLRVVFSELMTPDVALLDAASFTITEDAGSAPRLVLSVAVDGSSPSVSVLLTLDGPTTNGVANYNVAVDLSVSDLAGNGLDAAFADVDFDGLTPAPAEDHVALGLARLIEQYRDKDDCRAYLRALLTPLQTIEQALQDVFAYRSLSTAFGAQLDAHGQSMGIARQGLIDADYRRVLQGMAAARGAHGRGDEVLAILIALDGGFAPGAVVMNEHFPAGYITAIEVPLGRNDLGNIYAQVMGRVPGNAIRTMLMWQQQGADHFVWEGDTGEGFAEETDLVGTGGIWAEGV